MYLDYFGFDEPPFSITPDPKFVFLSKKHQESLVHLIYGITRGGGAGFVQLTGEVGTGKTTISRLLLEQIPEKTNIALILNPNITPIELLENICKELKIPLRDINGTLNSMVDKLNAYLLKSWSAGENTVVILDEAQNLPRDTLEQLRLLTNLETDKQKLLQIVLIGQPELRSTMRRNDLRQLAQRVTARYHLLPLSQTETFAYLQHRIKIAGGNIAIINKITAKTIYQLTAGIPRLINTLTDRSLLAAYADDKDVLLNKHINVAAQEVLPETHKPPESYKHGYRQLYIVAIVTAIFVLYTLYPYGNDKNNLQQSLLQDTTIINKKTTIAQQSFRPATAQKAWQAYFKLWDTQSDKNWKKTQCPNSSETAMACLRRQGNFKQIEKLNHPVLLQLDQGSLVLLSAIDNGKIRLLDQNNQFLSVKKDWIEQRWLGTYFVLWPMPAELLLNPDYKQMQKWSLEMANTIANDTLNSEHLNDWIINFQGNQGLLADGIIGPETQMALSLMAYIGPTLTH
ncbi:MAG: AAA family ATPase [Alcanivoracaceae bacterium]|nr:AAA family ATPase [Alcanivoracaceae bacterium]